MSDVIIFEDTSSHDGMSNKNLPRFQEKSWKEVETSDHVLSDKYDISLLEKGFLVTFS